MRRVLGLICLASSLFLSGCGMGGGLSQEDMRRYGIRRPPEPEQNQAPQDQTATNSNTQGKGNPEPNPNGQEPKGEKEGGKEKSATARALAARNPSAKAEDGANQADPATLPTDPVERAMAAWTALDIPLRRLEPGKELTAQERRTHAIISLRKIALALTEQCKDLEEFTPPASKDGSGRPLLSWRVLLLPYLGHVDLFEKFHLNEPWDSPHNKELLAEIPAEYQSPERLDEKTNYLVPTGQYTMFPGGTKPLKPNKVRDGLDRTVMLLEVDYDYAVPWTQPVDFEFQARSPRKGVGRTRGDGLFVAWGSGNVSRILPSKIERYLEWVLTREGEENVVLPEITRPLTVEPDPQFASLVAVAEANIRMFKKAAEEGVDEGVVNQDGPQSVELEDNFDMLASESFAALREQEGVMYSYAAMLASPEASGKTWLWYSALSRPALAVRWGVGVKYSGPRGLGPGSAMIGRVTDKIGGVPNEQALKECQEFSGEVGERLILELGRRIARGAAGEPLTYVYDPLKTPEQQDPATLASAPLPLLKPGVSYLGFGSPKQLTDLATKRDIDVLVLFDVEVRTTRSGTPHNNTVVRLHDVRRDKEIYASDVLSNLRVNKVREDRFAEDPLMSHLIKLFGYIDEQLQSQPLPSSLKPGPVAQRVEALVTGSSTPPLAALAEIRFYFDRKLLNFSQFAEACRRILGQEAGDQLAGGTRNERVFALKSKGLLPREPFREPRGP